MKDSLARIRREIVDCSRCIRLVEYCARIAAEKRKAFRDWEYWGKPVPGFGDPQARILIVGLAPAAHGGNRTGRVFTGDGSGDFLFGALHRAGLASHAISLSMEDDMVLRDVYITATVRCAPPDNKPLPAEFRNCREYLEREIAALRRLRIIIALGRIAFDTCLGIWKDTGAIASRSGFPFAHGVVHRMPPPLPVLIASYHPSQRNTLTGRLTPPMFDDVFRKAKAILATPPGGLAKMKTAAKAAVR